MLDVQLLRNDPARVRAAIQAKRTGDGARTISEATPEELDKLIEWVRGGSTTAGAGFEGEHLFASERLVVSPGAGIFEPHWTNFWHPPGTPKSKDDPHGANGVGHYACLDINLVHPIRTTQLAISRWLNPVATSAKGKASPSNPKRIVHISSIAGQTPGFPIPLYIASKHGMLCRVQIDSHY